MSFSGFANHVRNPALPHKRRVSALRSCVQLYRPIGFEATLSFLEELAGPFHRDDGALLRALDHLAASRALWHDDLRRYAAERRTAKQRGHRTPRRDDRNPNRGPAIWYGASQRAALHALTYWRRSRLPGLLTWNDPGASEIDACVSAALANGGPLSAEQHRRLNDTAQRLRERLDADLYSQDSLAYFRVRDLLLVAGFVTNATTPA
ncbi:hypothetical protein [Paractinoplanes toevensis]|uniref:Uncharacterized protein n=1 Tax=Paractinoplanes toevensis TaxID=571911 RepID=A0A919TID5_9ACTN|nr:hypothetical protein [Actinoplanes toevensis]GIM94915.1 hypothetical protein Ato02nite_067080 [Actinoplanes toevensis]